MAEDPKNARLAQALPRAKIKRSRLSWFLWLVPLGALALCGWFIFHDYIATGPVISLYFQSVEGLEEENTPIEYRGAQVGRIKTIQLTKDHGQVVVKARLAGSAANLARAGSTFWIVRPEVKVGAISGLRTLVTGEYIAVEPGTGPRTNSFVAVQKPPSPQPGAGLEIALVAPHLESIQEDSPVFYRGVQVGQVLRYQLSPDAREIVMRVLIQREYATLVRLNSKFWNAGGLNVRVGLLKGLEISAESAKALLVGGIEFATPPEVEAPAPEGTVFQLHEKPEETWKKWSPKIPLHLPEHAPEPQPRPQVTAK